MNVTELLYSISLLTQVAIGQNQTVESVNGQNQTNLTTTRAPIIDDITLEDIFISVKTTHKYHDSRLLIILLTWYQLAKEQIWFFTDKENSTLREYTNGHLVNTQCESSHRAYDLCCKMNVELDYYRRSRKKWFCHFDDDNFVNVPRLVKVLQTYDHKLDWYLGRSSLPGRTVVRLLRFENQRPTLRLASFGFATGGAGICISASLAIKMDRYIRNGRFVIQCKRIQHPDDVTIGFIIEYLLGEPLTTVSTFHSHLEDLRVLDYRTFQDQVSFSYALPTNVIVIPGVDSRNDSTRFLSLHCLLFPNHADFCENLSRK